LREDLCQDVATELKPGTKIERQPNEARRVEEKGDENHKDKQNAR